MKKILVTGCAGFIGSHVCELLLAKGFSVIGIDNFDPYYSREIKEKNISNFIDHKHFSFYEVDITNGLDAIKESGIEAVVHLAAKAGVRPSIQEPESYILANITGTHKVHQFMLSNSIRKLIFASSSSVYGNNRNVPFSEHDNVDNPISPYAFTKKSGELMNYTFHQLYNVDIINLRLFTVYGPRQRPDLAINKFVKKILNNETLVLFGNGDTARDYTYIDDTVAGIFSALTYCISNENLYLTLNLGNNNPIKLTTLVEKLYQILGKQSNLVFEPMQPGDVDVTFADISQATSILNYVPAVDIYTGLTKHVDWQKSREND